MSSASSSAVNGTRPLRRHISWVQVRVQLVLTSSCCNLGFEKSRSCVIGSWLNSRVSRVPLPFTGWFCIQKLFVSAKHVNKTTDLWQATNRSPNNCMYWGTPAQRKYNGDGGRGSQSLAWSNRDSWLSVTALHPGGNVWQGQTTFACVPNELFYSKHCNFDFIDFKVWPAFRLWRLLIWI